MPLGLVPALQPMASQGPNRAELAPPLGFRAAMGVRSAWLVGEGPFGTTPRRGSTAARRAGLRYEKAVLEHLCARLGDGFRPSPWFKFTTSGGMRYCQPDGLLCCANEVTIFECKYTFTAEAWWQLRQLYEPVVRAALRPARISHVVVCRRFDPAVAFPEEVQHTHLLEGWREALHSMGVYEWRP